MDDLQAQNPNTFSPVRSMPAGMCLDITNALGRVPQNADSNVTPAVKKSF